MEEIWKNIPNMPYYQASNLGRIKSLRTFKYSKTKNKKIEVFREKMLKPQKDKMGYLRITCMYGTKKVHRLVALAFIPNPNNYKEINHKDENKENNHVDNLEWCDRKYNINYGTSLQRRIKSQYKPIIQYDLKGNFIKEWEGIKIAKEKLNIKNGIVNCCRGLSKTSHGFIWKYKEEI